METPRPYQTRERLFYQADAVPVAHKETPAKQPNNPAPREFILDQVPQGSLYDSILEPPSPQVERKALAVETPIALPVVEDGWITVFGFPNGKAPAVLQLFSQLGPVEEHEAGQGNWLHLRYPSPWTVQRALAKNGTLCRIDEECSCLLGVIPKVDLPKSEVTVEIAALPRETPLFNQASEEQPVVQRMLKSLFGL